MTQKLYITESCKQHFNGTNEQYEEIISFLTEKFESGEIYVIEIDDDEMHEQEI